MMCEQVPTLADVDGSQLSGPFVHVAEQVPVNDLQVAARSKRPLSGVCASS